MVAIDPALVKRNQSILASASPLFEKLNQAWGEIDDFFRRNGVLVGCFVPVGYYYEDDRHDMQPIGEYVLGIQKIKGSWRVCYGTFDYRHASEISWTPVTECPIQERMDLLESVALLFGKVVETNEKYLEEIDAAVRKSDQVLAELNVTEL